MRMAAPSQFSFDRAVDAQIAGLYRRLCPQKSLDDIHVANAMQWDSAAHFQAMFHTAGAKAHRNKAAALALSVQPILGAVAYVGNAGPGI